MKYYFLFILAFILALSCKQDHKHAHNGDHSHAEHNHDNNIDGDQDSSEGQNVLTEDEKSKSWNLLFNGNDLNQWKGYLTDISPKWSASNGTLYFNPEVKGEGGDIITVKEYEDFELSLDWKISDCGNSGLFWNVVENEMYERTFHTGPELQILDNKCHPDAKITTHKAGDLYDLIETSSMTVKPAMQWNTIRIYSKDGAYTFYQNDVKVVEFTMHTPEWDKMVAGSKFKKWKAFGKATKGHIALQDHGNEVWFRNIKIREI